MALKDIIAAAEKAKVLDAEATEEFIKSHIKDYQDLIAYWRVYPDRLIDFYLSLGNPYHFKFYFYQRLYLRAYFRYKIVYATFVRAWSKSFMSVMGAILKCILYPNIKMFTVAAGKEQSAEILSGKVDEICRLIPAIEKEII